MKKNVRILIISLLLLIMMLVNVSASGINVLYNVETSFKGTLNQIVIVSGEDPSYSLKTVTLRVWQKGKTETDIDGRTSDIEVFSLIDQTKADDNGKFEFSFIMNKTAGNYTADVKVDGIGAVPVTLILSDVKKANDIVAVLNDSTKVETLVTADLQPILNDSITFGIDTNIYNRLSDKNCITSKIIEGAKKRIANNEKIVFEDFVSLYNEAVVLESFKQADDVTLLTDTVDIYDDFLGLSSLTGASNIYATYSGLSDKNAPLLKMEKTPYDSIGTLIESFKENVFTSAVKEVLYYTELEDAIENNSDYLALGDAYIRYEGEEDLKTHILKELTKIKDKINSVNDFKREFTNAIASYDNPLQGGEIILPPPPSYQGTGGGSVGGVSSSVSVSTELSKPEIDTPVVVKPSFTDMAGHWAKSAVETLVNKGVINGKEEGKFCPEDYVTREEFVKMIVTAFELEAENNSTFSDVPADKWSYTYIGIASKLNIVVGNNGMFMPTSNITRQDMAVVIYRTLQLLGYDATRGNVDVPFTDYDKISDYAKNSVTMLYYSNLISGDGENFNPHSNATRAEAAQMIYNVLKGE